MFHRETKKSSALLERSLRDLQKQVNFERHLQAVRTENDHARVEMLKHGHFSITVWAIFAYTDYLLLSLSAP